MAGRIILRSALLAIFLNSRLFVAAGTAGEDFTNNLFTDLAPLLGLFGEKFTKQFLAESFTFWDHLLFAMAPLGILTAIVGAIRVDGANWLKRLIGRARETTADAEIELMSSVSQEVCEVWNGASIVRSMGSPQVKQIIHLPARNEDFSPESFITIDRKTWSSGYELKAQYWSAKDTGSETHSTHEDNNSDIELGRYKNTVHPLRDEELNKNKEIPPNMSLNIHGGSNPVELVVYALIASISQAAVLVWSFYALEYKLSGSKPLVGFTLQAAGTVFLTLGLALCAGVIDNGSRERHWLIEGQRQVGTMSEQLGLAKVKFKALANKLGLGKDKSLDEEKQFRRHMQLYWVQKQHIAGDNRFDPYILYAEELKYKVHESHRAKENGQNDRNNNVHESLRAKKNVQNDRRNKFLRELLKLFGHHLTTIAAAIGVLGFVAQFQGLRFSHWSCSIAQLIALGFATILRAWVRRTMTKTPVAIPVDNNDHILDQLTLAIVGRGGSGDEFPHPKAFLSPELSLRFAVATYPKFRAILESKSKDQVRPRSGDPNQTFSQPADPGSQPSTNLHDSEEATEPKPEDEIQPRSEHLGSLEPKNPVTQHSTNVQDSREAEKKPNFAQQALDLRVRLGRITKWTGPNSQEAIVLANSIETALRTLSPKLLAKFGKKCAVVLRIDTYRIRPYLSSTSTPVSQEEVDLYIVKDGDVWKVDDGQLEALLSLVSYSVWAADQNKRSQDDTNRGKSLARSESSGHFTKESSVEDSQSTGWLRAKALDLQIYDQVVGESTPKLMFDLHWWIPDAKRVLKEARDRFHAVSTNSLSVAETSSDKVEQPALGFYVNDETSTKSGIVAIHQPLLRALTCPDTLCSWECKQRQVFVFHLFSTFIWAAAPHLSASQFHPTAGTSACELSQWTGVDFTQDFARVKSEKVEMLVQELQSTGLGTSGEIYKMLIPPLSHFNKLPNEAMADFWNKMLIEDEVSWRYERVFVGYTNLLHLVQRRKVQDRFANRVAAMFVEFRLRVTESPSALPQPYEREPLVVSNGHLSEFVNNDIILKAILSLNDVLARRWGLPMNGNPDRVLAKLECIDLISQPRRDNLFKEDLRTSGYTLSTDDFSFPGNGDVFGWTKGYWEIFENTEPVPVSTISDCSALDIAGRSVLHNKIDRNRATPLSENRDAYLLYGGQGYPNEGKNLGNSSIFVAGCNKQTPLHRAARLGHSGIVCELLEQEGTDPNAVDNFWRTPLSLAAHHGNSDLVRDLWTSMEPDGRARTDRYSRNALHYAVLSQKDMAAEELVAAGIDINAEDYLGRPPLWYAAWNDRKSVARLLLRRKEIQISILRQHNWGVQEEACLKKIEKWAKRVQGPSDGELAKMDTDDSGDSDTSSDQDHEGPLPLSVLLAGSDDEDSE